MNPIQPGASIQEMARSLMRTVDANGNGELSTEEFTSFLARLMTGVQSGFGAPASRCASSRRCRVPPRKA